MKQTQRATGLMKAVSFLLLTAMLFAQHSGEDLPDRTSTGDFGAEFSVVNPGQRHSRGKTPLPYPPRRSSGGAETRIFETRFWWTRYPNDTSQWTLELAGQPGLYRVWVEADGVRGSRMDVAASEDGTRVKQVFDRAQTRAIDSIQELRISVLKILE